MQLPGYLHTVACWVLTDDADRVLSLDCTHFRSNRKKTFLTEIVKASNRIGGVEKRSLVSFVRRLGGGVRKTGFGGLFA